MGGWVSIRRTVSEEVINRKAEDTAFVVLFLPVDVTNHSAGAKLKSEIQATNLIVAREYAPNYLGLGVNKNKFLEISSGFSILITVISIVGCCGLCVCRKWKKQSSIMKAVFETVKTERNSKRALRSQRYDLNMEYAPLRPKIIREEIVPVGTTISLEDVIAEEVQPTTAAIEQEEFQPRESTVVDVSTQVYSRKTITRVEHLSIEGNKK